MFSISHLLNPFNCANASEIQQELAEITAQQEALTEISPGIDRGEIFIVGTGDTLEDISKLLGIDLEDLEAANPEIEDPNLVYSGQVVTIP